MSINLAKLPSLDLLRGFVATGRRMSITLAAQDLFLTQSAVSRQIHVLESALGVRLFERGHRTISFTPDGERLFRVADNAVQEIQDGIGALQSAHMHQPVTLTASIAFVGMWLLPRLPAFQLIHPDVEVRLSANNTIVDIRKEGLDIAIRYCANDSKPPNSRLLFGETVFPVAHPSLGLRRLNSADAIARSVLLEFEGDSSPCWRWETWIEWMGWSGVRPKRVIRFNLFDQMIDAAVAGQGLALGRGQFIYPMLEDGRLVRLATPVAGPLSSKSYFLIQRDQTPSRDSQALIDWIIAEAEFTETNQSS